MIALHPLFCSFLEYDEITSTEWMEFVYSKTTGPMILFALF